MKITYYAFLHLWMWPANSWTFWCCLMIVGLLLRILIKDSVWFWVEIIIALKYYFIHHLLCLANHKQKAHPESDEFKIVFKPNTYWSKSCLEYQSWLKYVIIGIILWVKAQILVNSSKNSKPDWKVRNSNFPPFFIVCFAFQT